MYGWPCTHLPGQLNHHSLLFIFSARPNSYLLSQCRHPINIVAPIIFDPGTVYDGRGLSHSLGGPLLLAGCTLERKSGI